jgi:hypothetical protein
MDSVEFRCKRCGNEEGYRSRSRNRLEKYLLLLLSLRPMRCAHCFWRSYRSVRHERPGKGQGITGTAA